ncbi:MAG: hypothetical protein IT440_15410 [Phycisphaeraceae bacterium]|jgi:hypothetical protein|nr:hypothetical protein [Phycisphaeraceae bacterium]
MKNKVNPEVHNLRSPDSRLVCRQLSGLTNSESYRYLKELAEAIAEQHGGGLPKNDEDRERIYEAAIIRKGFKALWKIVEGVPPVGEANNPSDLLEQITIEQTPAELKKEE